MKKLMTMIAAVATAFGLYAADTGTSFEGAAATAGGTLADEVANINELSGGASSADWWYGATAKATIKDYNTETPYSGRNAKFGDTQDKYLKLETGTEELTRYADSAKAGVNVLKLTGKEYVFDSLVNLTAFDDAPVMTDGKLAVWLQDLSEADTPVAQTNLMVSMLVNAAQVNYNCGNLSDLNLDLIGKWARVTIKALDIGNSNIGFVVYINGSNAPIAWTTAGASIEYGEGLNDVAQFYANNKQLFPYAGDTNIGSVGFKGMGSVDDLLFTEDVPSFAADPSLFELTVGVSSGIESFEATYNGVTKTYKGTTPVKFVYSASANPQKVILSNVVCADGKFLKTMEFVVDGSNITIPDAVVAVAQVGEVKYDVLADAIAAAAGTENAVVLLTDANAITISGSVTLDLNGKKIATALTDVPAITLENGAALVIDDSLTTGKVAGFDGGDAIALANEATATLTIKAGQFDGFVCINNIEAVTVDAAAFGKLKVLKDNADVFDTSKCALTAPNGYEFVLKGDYFELQVKIQKIDITGAVVTASATYGDAAPAVTVTLNEQTIDPANYDISSQYSKTTAAGTVIAVTVTAKGDTYTGTASGEFTVTKKALTGVSVSLDVTEATFAAEKTTPGAYATPTITGLDGVDAGEYTAAWDKTEVTAQGGTFIYSVEAKADGNYTFATASVTLTVKAAAPIPPLPANPTADDVNTAVDAAKFADATVKAMIGGDQAKYNAFKTWADTVTGGEAAVVASAHAADSYLLGQTTLLQNAPASEIKTIAKTSDTALTLTFEIKDGANAVTVAQAAADYVKTLVQCNEKVDFGNGTKIDATVAVTINGTTLTAAVTLPANKPAAFMKVAK